MKLICRSLTAVALTLTLAVGSGAAYAISLPTDSAMKQEETRNAFYNSFTGVIQGVSDYEAIDGAQLVYLKTAEAEEGAQGEAHFIITRDTYLGDGTELAAGQEVTGFYVADRPMIAIYPPQYSVEVVVAVEKERMVTADVFDGDLLSEDGSLKLSIGEDTEVVTMFGLAVDYEPANSKLVVYYSQVLESYPAQTTPEKVVILFDRMDGGGMVPGEGLEPPTVEVPISEVILNSELPLTVAGEQLTGSPKPFLQEGTVMVPLRAVAEALGYTVEWKAETQTVTLGTDLQLTVGSKQYTGAAGEVTLSQEPVLTAGLTYVPLNFFTSVAGLNNAYVFEGAVVIDNGERMQ